MESKNARLLVFSLRTLLTFLFLFLAHQFIHAQALINGIVYNRTTGAPIDHATVALEGKKTYLTISDSSGAFVLRTDYKGKFTLTVTHIACYTYEDVLAIQRDTVLHLYLEPADDSLDEVMVTARSPKPLLANIQLSLDDISQRGSVLGEANVYEALQRQAGVIHTNELNTGLYVRGLGSGHTGVLIDGINTYSGNHLLGIYPVVNANAYASVKMLKEDIHPQYNGYLSSCLLLETDDDISNKVTGHAELGVLTSKLGLKVPLVKKKVGLISNIRRSYFDIISNTYNNIFEDKKNYSPLPSYGFYDWSNTINIKAGEKWLVKVNTFLSRDKLLMGNENINLNADWKNWSVGAHWQYQLNRKAQIKVNVGHSEYTAHSDFTNLMKQMKNKISESSTQANLFWQAAKKVSLNYGLQAKYSMLSMHSLSLNEAATSIGNFTVHDQKALNLGSYIYGHLSPRKGISVKLGSLVEYYRSDKTFFTFSPTFSTLISSLKQSLFLDISRRVQFSHLYVPLGIQLPMNIWYPSTRKAPPENAWHLSGTYSRVFNKRMKGSLSAYYILLDNQIEFLDKNYFSALDFKTSIGKGSSKGIEFNLYYQDKRFDIEGHYTLGKSTCQFPEINSGKAYSLSYDIRHKIDFSLSWQWHRNWMFSISQFFQSGFLITIPSGLYLHQEVDGSGIIIQEVPIYTDRNNFRMPYYHRMDVSVKQKFLMKKLKCSWSAGIFNTYSYKNPYFIYFSMVKNEQNQTFLQARKKSILPLVPFFSIHTEF